MESTFRFKKQVEESKNYFNEPVDKFSVWC